MNFVSVLLAVKEAAVAAMELWTHFVLHTAREVHRHQCLLQLVESNILESYCV
jgi:hypothetical protein